MNQQFKLLLIEDDPAVGQSLRTGLEWEGFAVMWVERGQEGVDYAHDHHPHLVILDVQLPDGSGFDFCRQMRQSGLRLPIIMLTVRHEEVDKVVGLTMGADDYVTKPFGLRELIARIRAQLRRVYGDLAAGGDSDLLYAGDLVIDQGRAQVRRGKRLLNLTPTEFRLLVYLARHPGQALSRAQILDSVWGYESDVSDERTVDVHVHRLRENIELDPSRPSSILTVPGIGYRFVG
jgi:two-component system response regulator VicR